MVIADPSRHVCQSHLDAAANWVYSWRQLETRRLQLTLQLRLSTLDLARVIYGVHPELQESRQVARLGLGKDKLSYLADNCREWIQNNIFKLRINYMS